jgi:heat shock transcription factor
MEIIEARISSTEQKQQQMTVFLVLAMNSASFLQLLVDRQERRRELQDALSKKRHRPQIECVPARNGETSSSASYSPAAV